MISLSTKNGFRGGRRAVGKPKDRREGAVRINVVYLLQIWNCTSAVTLREGWGKEIGETTTRSVTKEEEEKEV
jgi:hypothetical protein